jgi:hypothetical protein
MQTGSNLRCVPTLACGGTSPAGAINVSSRHGASSVADPRQAEEHAMNRHVLSFEPESVRYRQHRRQQNRHHWMICLAKSPDTLVSWGYAATHELAETEARKGLTDLISGLTQGGQQLQTHHAFLAASTPLRGIRQKRPVR